MIQFNKPVNLNGEELIVELESAGVSVIPDERNIKAPFIDGSGNFWLDIAESDTTTALTYNTGADLAQSTAFQPLMNGLGSDADQQGSGTLTLFNPSSTTYVKHFITHINTTFRDDASYTDFVAGYGNTTSAINAIQFKMGSGNFDGTIKMYGVKKS
jgi:hypothetical protein